MNQLRQARHTDRYLAFEWEGCQHSKRPGEARDLLDILWKVQGAHPPSASQRQERWVCPFLVCPGSSFEPLAEDQAPGPRTEEPLYCLLPAQAPGPCFLFIPCCWDSIGRNSAPLPHCSDTNVYSPQGLLRDSTREGDMQGVLTKGRLCAGAPGVHRAWMERTGANLSHTGQPWTKGQGQSKPAARGPPGRRKGKGLLLTLWGGPLSQSPMGSEAVWMNEGCNPVLWGRGGCMPWAEGAAGSLGAAGPATLAHL